MKNILITGASRGLGLHITRKVLKKGLKVFASSRKISPELRELQTQFPGQLHYRAADLSNPQSIKEVLFKDFIPLDLPLYGIVNNAAMALEGLGSDLQLDEIQKLFTVNVYSPMLITREAIRNMLYHQTAGSLVHISSISTRTGYKGISLYAGSKGAIEAFSKSIAREWGPKGIRSNCILAGFMETDMIAQLSSEQKQKIASRNALKVSADPQSVADTVVFLLSEGAASITGQNIAVDAGTI